MTNVDTSIAAYHAAKRSRLVCTYWESGGGSRWVHNPKQGHEEPQAPWTQYAVEPYQAWKARQETEQ